MPWLSLVFIAATVLWTLFSFYLSLRQSTFVARHRGSVPDDFAASLSLAEHQKAADYSLARERLDRWETLVATLVPIAFALGGIDLLYNALSGVIAPGIWRGVAFLVGTGVVGAVASFHSTRSVPSASRTASASTAPPRPASSQIG